MCLSLEQHPNPVCFLRLRVSTIGFGPSLLTWVSRFLNDDLLEGRSSAMSFCILHSIQHRSVNSWPLKRVHYVNMMYCMAQREILCTLISMTVIHLGGQQAMKPKIGTIQELGKHHTAYSCFPFWCLPHIFNAKALTKCPCH